MSTDTGAQSRAEVATPFRYGAALADEIERRWQDRWEREGTFHAPNPGEPGSEREKVYLLDMFPYPSGSGLHVGHPLGFIGTDVLGRYLRMTGRNVLHAMGFDAFGLPAEQYAALGGHHGHRVLPLDAVDLPEDLQLLVRRGAAARPPGGGAGP